MELHLKLSNEEFTTQFKKGALSPDLFTHQAHLRLAWLHISHYGIDQAITNITTQIKNYTRLLGAEDKYHETVTIAAIRAVYHFMMKSTTNSFPDFIAENTRLQTHFKALLASHYSYNVFNHSEAKASYIAPDLLAFD